MAGATLLAIISFLFLGVIIQLLGGRGGPGRQIETIAECRRFGKITAIQLDQLQKEQDVLQRFLIVLQQKLALVDPTNNERMEALRDLYMFVQQVARPQSPERLISTWLVTQYVQEEGLSPDWKEVSELLKQLTGGYLSDAIYDDALKSVGVSHQTVEYLLARHLMWQQAMSRFGLSVSAVSPATRWSWYQRLYRQVTVEAAAVSTDSFISQVGEPTAAQLNALFEKGKTKKYDPTSPESGFIMPMEVAFEYAVAAPTQKLLDSITEEEMREYYEKNKDAMFRKPVTPLPEFPTLPGMMPSSTLPFPTPGRSATQSPALEPEGALEPEETLDLFPEVEPATVSPEEETSLAPNVSTRLVSYQVEDSDIGGLTFPAPAEDESEPIDLNILYKPFDEVKEEIRKTLALGKAMTAIIVIQEKMREYTALYNEHFEQGKPIPAMPDLTSFVAEQGLEWKTVPLGDVHAVLQIELARGLAERQSLIEMFRSPPLKFEGATFLGSDGQMIVFWITDQKPEKRPEKLDEVRDIVLKRWKEIEARSLVQKKAEELANEAKSSGKPLAEVFAGRSDVPVVETEPFTWKSYGSIPPYMAAARGIPPMLGEVREKGVVVGDSELDNQWIVAPGTDFMETVYSLQKDEIGTVFNQPQSVAYVVRITNSEPEDKELWERFQGTQRMEYFAGQPEMISSAFEAWLTEIQTKTGFRWVNKPDAREPVMSGGYYE